jgi:glycosyltransferase involved in cell wall biosynthesis
LLPVYNGGVTLHEAIESILGQSERDFEFLIIDDASSDESREVLRDYASQDSRIRLVLHDRNVGLSGTLNEGLEQARTDLVVRIDQDDIALPERLELQVRFMESRPDVGAAGSHVYHMGRSPQHDRLVELPAEHEEIMQILPRQNCMYHPAMILRRRTALDIGGYRQEFKNAEDYDLWLRLSRHCRLANLQVPLLRYRFSVSGMSLSRRWQQMRYVQMAIVSYQKPFLRGAALETAADEALARIDRDTYFEQVARGTLMELVWLRNWADAWVVYWVFSRNMRLARAAPLAAMVLKQLALTYTRNGPR